MVAWTCRRTCKQQIRTNAKPQIDARYPSGKGEVCKTFMRRFIRPLPLAFQKSRIANLFQRHEANRP